MSETRQLTQMLHMRTRPELYARLAAQAAREGISMPSLCRRILVAAMDAPASEAVEVPATRRETAPEDIQQLRGLRADVARLNGALVQAAIRVREANNFDLHSVVEAAINDNKELGRSIDKVLRRLT
ncbi:hypothetical protein [Thalassospira povalilytica]|uniref:hypothetical protein n=1 Tax=Thalassospira povalilytica TaxID=732237 RepID=UPI001D18AA13|nr:hypothetical protein [Thalassospira povalilytica]MCC4240920.1 hypothetical protein [Thalassospira povalilytica]